ncbi:SAVED domain-containing protein [Variovorax sp. PvP013]|uniref:SAVED domain-containing protein n=1 Tax=Variovorax sp. PvP013 TaxID=3156435 RepID=UPI003D235E22
MGDDEQSHVVEVTFEAKEPKGFDDVVVRYRAPGRPISSQLGRIAVDFHQVKFHAVQGGRFGYEDLVKPEFINAKVRSLLQGLRDTKKTVEKDAAFFLVTTDRVADEDPLGEILSTKDHSLHLEKLFGKGGDRSKFGRIRKLWREHLELATDDELREVLQGFHIRQMPRSLDDLREDVNMRLQLIGMVTCRESMDFRYDQIARELFKKRQNCLNREQFAQLCRDEGWLRVDSKDVEAMLNVSLRSFADVFPEHLDAAPQNALSLVDVFEGRHLSPGQSWAMAVQAPVEKFLLEVRQRTQRIRLHLDAHLSIAFLGGSIFNTKSGTTVELVQKGRTGLSIWRADDGKAGPSIPVATHVTGNGDDVAVVVSLSRDGLKDVMEYAAQNLPRVGRFLHAKLQTGSGQMSVVGGAHAATLADTVVDAVREHRPPKGASTHIFIVGPNSFAFYLGQHAVALGACVLYEFDFNNTGTGSYQPSITIG